jgi:hypothetical protein
MRAIDGQGNTWYHVGYAQAPQGFTVAMMPVSSFTNGSGGLAYVPAGSPDFPQASLLVSDLSQDSVRAFEVDSDGDPVMGKDRVFLSMIMEPLGTYFEEQTGDFLFAADKGSRLYIVEGFAKPPPPPN